MWKILRGALILRGPIDLKVLMLFDVHCMFCEPFRVKGALILRFQILVACFSTKVSVVRGGVFDLKVSGKMF